MCPCPSAARLAPGNQLIRQEQRRGCFLKANNKQSCFFFFFPISADGRAGLGSGWHSQDARAGQARGACADRGAGARGRPRSLARAGLRGNGLAGGRGRAAWAAAAAISAASCSSRPRRHGNGVTHRGRFPALLARVTPAARAPSSLTCWAAALPPHRRPPPRHPGPVRAPRRPILPASPPGCAGSRGPGGS